MRDWARYKAMLESCEQQKQVFSLSLDSLHLSIDSIVVHFNEATFSLRQVIDTKDVQVREYKQMYDLQRAVTERCEADWDRSRKAYRRRYWWTVGIGSAVIGSLVAVLVF